MRRYIPFLIPLMAISASYSRAEDTNESESAKETLDAMVLHVAAKNINDLMGAQLPFLELNYFAPDHPDAGSPGWKLDYDWQRRGEISQSVSEDYSYFSARSFSAHAKGSYVLGNKVNLHDLSSFGFSYAFMGSVHPPLPKEQVLTGDVQAKYESICLTGLHEKPPWCSTIDKRLNASVTGPGFTWTVKANAELEGNQSLSQKQYVYSLGAGFSFVPGEDGMWRNLNIFELPFRQLTRPLLGGDSDAYRDREFPSVYVGLERVNAKDNQQRQAALGHKDNYNRAYVEVGYVTSLGRIKNTPLKFNYHYTYYRELNPAAPIVTASLDRFRYATYSVELSGSLIGIKAPQAIEIKYATGQLPFDRQSQAVYEIGWKTNISPGALFSTR